MSRKLEMLKEVNAMITERCTKIETKIFLESSNGINGVSLENSNPKTPIEAKR